MFQPTVKLEFVRRYCSPHLGWRVFVDIDPSETGRTGGERAGEAARERQATMMRDGDEARRELTRLGATVGGSRASWATELAKDYPDAALPSVCGDRDIIAVNAESRRLIVAEVEGASSGQPEQKLYKAIGQIVLAVGATQSNGFQTAFVIVVHGNSVASHLRSAVVLKRIGISGLSLGVTRAEDEWLFMADNLHSLGIVTTF
jgi:hypothetical protein